MKKLFFLLMIATGLSSGSAWAQTEICNNGIDDDFDGFIDCYDGDCANNQWCEGFYMGNDVLCEAVPSQFPKFTMTLDFASPNETTNHIGRMSIGDLDRDGIPEIATMNRYTKELIILNGNDGSVKTKKKVTWTPLWEIALGNIDNDNCAELFYQGYSGDDLYLYAYDCDLNQIWSKKIRTRTGRNGDALDAIMYGLADFDGDGKVELYLKDMILDAHTGTIIINTSATTDNEWNKINGGPVAVDILGDSRLELVSGCNVYDINLGTRAANSGTRTLLASRTEYEVKNPYNATSVADYNLDGHLDVLASGGERISGNLYTTIFFWDVFNNTLKTYSEPINDWQIVNEACNPPDTDPSRPYRYGWTNGTGRLNVADLDGDGKMNVSYVSGKYLYALDENLEKLWRITVNEETSGYTGCTLFDFNGDGSSEIVYRDERYLYIINGTDGSIFSQQPCISRTNREYPIVADVDGDGSTELCITCGFNDADSWSNFCDLSYARYSHVRVFKSAAEPWVPARRLWNQHGYFNVNVNDDLSIPRNQQKHHLVWSVGNCTQGPNRPLNNFLNQSPFLNSQGCPTYAAPNIAYVDNSLSVVPPTCPDGNFQVTFQIQNIGDVSLSGQVPITFYDGNPEQTGATRLNTVLVNLNNFNVGSVHTVMNATVEGPGSEFILYIVLNDNGTTVPTPISLPNTDFLECDYSDNIISAPVVPLPVSIVGLKVADNIKCIGSTAPDNGAVRAYVSTGGGQNTADYNFYWSIGAVAKPVGSADHVGATYNNIPDGTYTVYAIHKTAGCQSDIATVVVDRIESNVNVEIIEDRSITDCKEPNGKLIASVNGGDAVGKYTFEWYEGNDFIVKIGTSHVINNLAAMTYSVVVTEKATGCKAIESYTLEDKSVQPVVTVDKTDLLCSDSNSGSVSATVGGVVAGYKFDWYRGAAVKPSADYSGANVTGLAAGQYTVVATDNSTKCSSAPVTVTLVQTVPPVVTASVTANQTSCDPGLPNGSASASVGGTTTGYSFEWFRGQNTLLANRVATTSTASGLAAGIYTVKVTDDVTGCTDTEEVTVMNNVVTPSIVMGAVGSFTNCNTPNGSVEANVSLDSPSDYTFFWYKGASVKATPDFTDTDNKIEGLEPGMYTVRAVHNTKHCETAPATATVLDESAPVTITVQDALTVLPNDCDEAVGSMTVTISAPGNTNGFDVEWYYGIAPNPPIFTQSGVTTSTGNGLRSGLYTIKVVNRDNGCEFSDTFDLPFANAHDLDLVSQVDVDKCDPTDIGQITVHLTRSPDPDGLPGAFKESDYEIHVYKGTNDMEYAVGHALDQYLIQVINGVDGTYDYSTAANLEPGWYTLVAISKNNFTINCRSVPLQVEILQDVNDPVIAATQIDANVNCEGMTANGRIQLTIDNGAPATNYSIVWYEGTDTSAPVLGTTTTGTTSANNTIAENLPAGFYTVEVINTSPVNTSCSSTATFQIFDNPPIVSIASADVQIQHLTRCDVNNSSATIFNVMENGAPVGLANYLFTWYDADMNVISGPAAANSIAALTPGTYFVEARNSVNNCAAAMVQFEIEEQTMGTVGIEFVSFESPTRCLQPTNILGELHVIATGTGGSYTYNWYEGVGTTGTLLHSDNNGDFTGITIPAGQLDATFTVEVINNDNNCSVTETYVLPVDTRPIMITATASPLTNCDIDDGSVFATVTTPGANNYTYNWFIGSEVKPATDFPAVAQPAKQIDGLPAGEYTVVAVDNSDAGCSTTPITVMIENQQVMPVVSAMGLAPVSNCDPARPNGVATATVNGTIVGYRFEWFEGADDTGTFVYEGSEPGNLKAMQYTVRATDVVSGCSGMTTITIGESLEMVPSVDVEVLSNVTSCVEDNGALAASVGGNTADYIFDWYIGTTVKATPDHTGEYFTGLAVGTYTVTATSKITGCVSAPVSADIIEQLEFPDFDFVIVPASCDSEDGYLSVFPTNNVVVASIEWTYNGMTINGPNLSEIPAGVYSVTMTTELGCSTTKEVEIKPEIKPFQGISRNGDELNKLFHINCISDFPNNVVRIFNRAGTLVYEAEGYDNIDVYFDGRSNRGIAVLGNNLPDGTYFYVIDKRDGSKPVAGYLEIVN